MNEYYKSRYNLSKFFLNIDTDTYNNYLNIIIPILYIIPVILLIFLIIFAFKTINLTIIIYIIMYVILILLTFRLIFVLTSIKTSPILNNYKNYYNLANTIYKENFNYSQVIRTILEKKLFKNINNIENVYGENASILLNNSFDLLQYDEINEEYTTKIYIKDFKKFKFLNKSMGFIEIIKDNYNLDANNEPNIDYYIINLKILEEYYPESIEKKLLLKYLNDKYQTKLNILYQPSIFTPNFSRKFNKLIEYYKNSIYLYLAIITYFIIILLQGLFLIMNIGLTYIYLVIIIIAILLMYIYINI